MYYTPPPPQKKIKKIKKQIKVGGIWLIFF